jgi:hypothetical protein
LPADEISPIRFSYVGELNSKLEKKGITFVLNLLKQNYGGKIKENNGLPAETKFRQGYRQMVPPIQGKYPHYFIASPANRNHLPVPVEGGILSPEHHLFLLTAME